MSFKQEQCASTILKHYNLHFTRSHIDELEKIFKINLINSCSGYKSANLIGTVSSSGLTNVAVFSSVTHLGSNPPLLGFILRPTTVPRHTYTNIKQQKYFSINHIYQDIIADAHHTSAKYPQSVSEFEMTSLEEEFKDSYNIPFVKGAPVQMAMKFIKEYHIKANDVLLIVGEIVDLYIDDDLIESDGFVNLSKGNVAAINGLDAYSVPKLKNRYGYQRPNEHPKIK